MVTLLKKLILAGILGTFSTVSLSQIKVIVPYTAGGAVDQMARNFARYIEITTGENVNVENVTGAGSIIGTQRLLSSNANNSLLFTNNSHFVNILQGHFKADEFKITSMIGEAPYILIGSKTKNLTCADLRDSKKQIFLGTAGKDSASSTAASLIMKRHGHAVEVPYRGVSAAILDMLADRIDITFAIGLAHNRPDVNMIANTSNKKYNNIPSWNECLGVTENYIVEYMIVLNSSAPPDFVQKMNRFAFMFAKDPKTASYFKENGITDTTGNLSETDMIAQKSFLDWKKIFQTK